MIHVTPMSKLDAVVRQIGASRLITLLTEGSEFRRPAEISDDNHLHLTMHDIAGPRAGMTPPDAGHIRSLLTFAAQWDRTEPLVINCFAGISRSTAAAFVIWCALSPDRDEAEMAKILRERSPSATPNPLIVSLGDQALRRDGRMSAAISVIGRGAEAFEGEPFALDV